MWIKGSRVRDADQKIPGQGPELCESEDLSEGVSQRDLLKGARKVPPVHLTLAA